MQLQFPTLAKATLQYLLHTFPNHKWLEPNPELWDWSVVDVVEAKVLEEYLTTLETLPVMKTPDENYERAWRLAYSTGSKDNYEELLDEWLDEIDSGAYGMMWKKAVS